MKRILLVFTLFFVCYSFAHAQSRWEAPQETALLTNPLAGNAVSVEKGAKLYRSLCASCHGVTGRGDVPAMQALHPKPTNFTTQEFQSQKDGTIFWKLSEGKGLMASYKSMLSENDRWALVNYLRTFGAKNTSSQRQGHIALQGPGKVKAAEKKK